MTVKAEQGIAHSFAAEWPPPRCGRLWANLLVRFDITVNWLSTGYSMAIGMLLMDSRDYRSYYDGS